MSSKDSHQTKKFSIPSDLKWMPRVVAEVESVVREVGFDEETGDFLAIAATEAVSNAIIHGNKQDVSKEVHVSFKLDDDELTISVADEGGGFNPEDCDDPTDPKNISKGSGRGLFILKTLMDKVDILSAPKGTTITMTKFKLKKRKTTRGGRRAEQ